MTWLDSAVPVATRAVVHNHVACKPVILGQAEGSVFEAQDLNSCALHAIMTSGIIQEVSYKKQMPPVQHAVPWLISGAKTLAGTYL